MENNTFKLLPPKIDLETRKVLKQLARSHRALAELIITTNILIEIQQYIEQNRAGIRKLPGTVLRNETTGEVVYTPPLH